ncbi:Csu type fimbrial protein [Umezakia ovalisporum]|uniref:Csu type fimbrial protein n=1 Tax=Umezakia ovalisporum TaxID=75695 RepID=UPI002475AAA2|nr:spore coat U domain-containing protein [Umezakia ovalisporum]MDH6087640.1 spore coat protein U domain-containing protein [Umezakia ovalisporum Ak1311]
MIRRFVLASAILIAAGSAAPAMANTASTDLTVQATVIAGCTISTDPINFGDYDPIGNHSVNALYATGTVITTCTSGSSTRITLDQGVYADPASTNNAPLRRLSDGSGNFLSYGLSQNASGSLVWGNDANSDLEVLGTGSAQNNTIYGAIPPGQLTSVGSYSDTVVATVDF